MMPPLNYSIIYNSIQTRLLNKLKISSQYCFFIGYSSLDLLKFIDPIIKCRLILECWNNELDRIIEEEGRKRDEEERRRREKGRLIQRSRLNMKFKSKSIDVGGGKGGMKRVVIGPRVEPVADLREAEGELKGRSHHGEWNNKAGMKSSTGPQVGVTSSGRKNFKRSSSIPINLSLPSVVDLYPIARLNDKFSNRKCKTTSIADDFYYRTDGIINRVRNTWMNVDDDDKVIKFIPNFTSTRNETLKFTKVDNTLKAILNKLNIQQHDDDDDDNHKYIHQSTPEVRSPSSTVPLGVEPSPPEVHPAVSSSNYLSLKGIATPRDRGEEEGVEDVTSSGIPAADLREAEGEVNRGGRLQDEDNVVTTGGYILCPDDMDVSLGVTSFYMGDLDGVNDEFDLLPPPPRMILATPRECMDTGELNMVRNVEITGLEAVSDGYNERISKNTIQSSPIKKNIKRPNKFTGKRNVKNLTDFFDKTIKNLYDDNSPSEVSPTVNSPPPEVQSNSRSPAVSSPNYLPVNGRATPGDRGDVQPLRTGILPGGTGNVNPEERNFVSDVTSSGKPTADLREAEGEVNRGGRLQDEDNVVTSGGKAVCKTTKVGEVNDVTSSGTDIVTSSMNDSSGVRLLIPDFDDRGIILLPEECGLEEDDSIIFHREYEICEVYRNKKLDIEMIRSSLISEMPLSLTHPDVKDKISINKPKPYESLSDTLNNNNNKIKQENVDFISLNTLCSSGGDSNRINSFSVEQLLLDDINTSDSTPVTTIYNGLRSLSITPIQSKTDDIMRELLEDVYIDSDDEADSNASYNYMYGK